MKNCSKIWSIFKFAYCLSLRLLLLKLLSKGLLINVPLMICSRMWARLVTLPLYPIFKLKIPEYDLLLFVLVILFFPLSSLSINLLKNSQILQISVNLFCFLLTLFTWRLWYIWLIFVRCAAIRPHFIISIIRFIFN